MKGLLIAYAFAPQKTVGALRPSYWAEEINNLSDIEIEVVTATPSVNDKASYKRHFVENTASSIWSRFIKDEGLTWKKNLVDYFDRINVDQFDFVIITGGPFFHFSIGKYLKKRGLKVIYDFRDPFSYNPRLQDKSAKRFIKERFERRCLKHADLVLTVNDACHEYIAKDLIVKRGIIPNGYDDRIVVPQQSIDRYDFFYGGKFYWEPDTFFDVLESKSYTFCHAGRPQSYPHNYMKSSSFHQVGMLKQEDMYTELAKSEIGVVFTMDVPFESTTKIYDYLALGKKILIVTKGEPHTGVLNRELKSYPLFKWVRNNESEISRGIEELKKMELIEVDTKQFSRKAGLLKLIQEIKELFNG